jgi:hypothetical protein
MTVVPGDFGSGVILGASVDHTEVAMIEPTTAPRTPSAPARRSSTPSDH